MGDVADFLSADKHQRFFQVDTTQNNKFTISLEYHKK